MSYLKVIQVERYQDRILSILYGIRQSYSNDDDNVALSFPLGCLGSFRVHYHHYSRTDSRDCLVLWMSLEPPPRTQILSQVRGGGIL